MLMIAIKEISFNMLIIHKKAHFQHLPFKNKIIKVPLTKQINISLIIMKNATIFYSNKDI